MTDRKSMTAEQLEVVRRKDRERYAAKKKYPEFCAHHYAISMTWKQTHRERYRELQRRAMRRFRKRHPGYYKKVRQEQRILFSKDAKAYAEHLSQAREYTRKYAEMAGRIYKPRLSRRIPAYCTFGEYKRIAISSPFMRVNISPSRLAAIDGYARELFIDRKRSVV